MPISAVNLLWLTDPHDVQGIPTPSGAAVPSIGARKRVSMYLISTAVVSGVRCYFEVFASAKAQDQFTGAIKEIKDARPPALFISGYNPLTILYDVLSDGIHDLSDEECLTHARTVRTSSSPSQTESRRLRRTMPRLSRHSGPS